MKETKFSKGKKGKSVERVEMKGKDFVKPIETDNEIPDKVETPDFKKIFSFKEGSFVWNDPTIAYYTASQRLLGRWDMFRLEETKPEREKLMNYAEEIQIIGATVDIKALQEITKTSKMDKHSIAAVETALKGYVSLGTKGDEAVKYMELHMRAIDRAKRMFLREIYVDEAGNKKTNLQILIETCLNNDANTEFHYDSTNREYLNELYNVLGNSLLDFFLSSVSM